MSPLLTHAKPSSAEDAGDNICSSWTCVVQCFCWLPLLDLLPSWEGVDPKPFPPEEGYVFIFTQLPCWLLLSACGRG